jgi:hypothetical protein
MADLTDAANALVQTIAAIAYPNGPSQPSITGAGIKIYQGWPDASVLTTDLVGGIVHVSVFPHPGDKITSVTHTDEDWQELTNNGLIGTGVREIRRQTRTFQITVWANCFASRDPLAAAIDAALAATTRMVLPDGSQAIIGYVNSLQNDDPQKAGIYRRDLMYSVNYATTQTLAEYAILKATINVSGGGFAQAGPTITINP